MADSLPIQADYILTEEETAAALVAAGRLKPHRVKSIIQSVTMMICAALFLYYSILDPANVTYKIIFAVCVLVIPSVWIFPEYNRRKIVRAATKNIRTQVQIFENKIEILAGESADKWEIELNQSIDYCEQKDVYILFLEQAKLFVLPKRALDEDQIPVIEEIIKSTARPRFS